MSRFRAVLQPALFALTCLVLGAHPGLAQNPVTLDPDMDVADDGVNDIVRFDNTIYICGIFTHVGKPSGGGVLVDPATGDLVPGFPRVDGIVNAVVPDGSGGVYIGGFFSHVGVNARRNLAHVLSDLSVEPWTPDPDDTVYCLAPGASGSLYVGGTFSSIGGQPRTGLAQLAISGAATTWNPHVAGLVTAMQVYGSALYIGGTFSSAGGQACANLAALDVSSANATGWGPPISSGGLTSNGIMVRDLKVFTRSNGVGSVTSVFVGGSFDAVGATGRRGFAEIDLANGLVPWSAGLDGDVYSIDGSGTTVYLGGTFTHAGGSARNYAAAFQSNTHGLLAWDPGLQATDLDVEFVRSTASGVLVSGTFATSQGQSRPNAALTNAVSGAPSAWNPAPDHPLHGVATFGSSFYVGGSCATFRPLPRNGLAAIDAISGRVLPWDPMSETPGTIPLHLALYTVGPNLYTVFVGGLFDFTDGLSVRHHGAFAVDAASGSILPWGWNLVSGAFPGVERVNSFSVHDSTLYVAGLFDQFNGQPRASLAAVSMRTGALLPYVADAVGRVFATAVSGDGGTLYLGGSFSSILGVPRNRLAAVRNGVVTPWNPNLNGPVNAMMLADSTLEVGGSFTLANGIVRKGLARYSGLGGNNPTAWLPVFAGSTPPIGMARVGNDLYIASSTNNALWRFDETTGDTLPCPSITPGGYAASVFATGPRVYVAGGFKSLGGLARGGFGDVGIDFPPFCAGGATTTAIGGPGRAIARGKFSDSSVPGLAVCSENGIDPPAITFLAGNGDGTFASIGSANLPGRPMQVIARDFDGDGYDDVAVSCNGPTSVVEVFRNGGGFFNNPAGVFLNGHADGLACADMDNDGILDLAVCMSDSAGIPAGGGVQILRGGGTGGVWNGSFQLGPKLLTGATTIARRLVLQDFNNDGRVDVAYTGSSNQAPTILRMGPGLVPVCVEGATEVEPLPGLSGVGIVSGDFNGDGRPDVAMAGDDRSLHVFLKNTTVDPSCGAGSWFTTGQTIALEGTARDLVAMDYDQDGILDLVAALDSVLFVTRVPGLGAGGVGNGTFGLPQNAFTLDPYGLAAGDFVTNGAPDLAVSQWSCNSVTVLPRPSNPSLPAGLTLLTPNGGEVWSQVHLPPPSGTERVASMVAGAPAYASQAQSAPALVEGSQAITWSKGAGVPAVDVSVSRDAGATWLTIAHEVTGTSMPWILTPPATSQALVRVSDSAVPSRHDESNAVFQVSGGTTGVDGSLPRLAAFVVEGRNPAVGVVQFRIDVPARSDVLIEVFDVSGRRVGEILRGGIAPGRHAVSWDPAHARGGARAGGGVYFVRARIGDWRSTRKVVVL